jgi:hypothetical protein
VKKTLQSKQKAIDWTAEKARLLLGETGAEGSNPGRIRRFYTNTYKALDIFDQMWYECQYEKRDRDWKVNYAWSVILAAMVNARSAYKESLWQREPMKQFARELVSELQDYADNM